ncbi:hypothetical protein AWI35_09975 [Klebsiella aerogenes]|nr:hypothetical protein AWI35_09975 [Klebsiella aerogenes]
MRNTERHAAVQRQVGDNRRQGADSDAAMQKQLHHRRELGKQIRHQYRHHAETKGERDDHPIVIVAIVDLAESTNTGNGNHAEHNDTGAAEDRFRNQYHQRRHFGENAH